MTDVEEFAGLLQGIAIGALIGYATHYHYGERMGYAFGIMLVLVAFVGVFMSVELDKDND